MHFRTYIEEKNKGQAGKWLGTYADAMVQHDKNVGEVLKALDDAGIADDTFVMYSTDNGPHMNSWPDAAMTPFRSEKIRTGKVLTVFPPWFAGRARFSRAAFPTQSFRTTTGCPH